MDNSNDTSASMPAPEKRHKAESRLGELFSRVVDIMDIAVWELNLDYRIKACNKKAMKLYGDDIVGRNCFSVAARVDKVCHECAAKQVYEGAATGRTEHQRVDISGNTIHIDHIATPIHDELNELTGVLVLIIDISHQKKLEEELREHQDRLEDLVAQRTTALEQSEQKYRALVMQLPDCLILHDLQGAIVDVNPSSCSTYGYSRKELLGMKVSDLDPDYHAREMDGAFWEKLTRKQPKTFRARQRKKDGTIFPAQVHLSLVEIDHQTLVLVLCRDISAHMKGQEERAHLKAQFHQAQKLESVGRLAGGVAHDLNNLLAPILGYSELLLDDSPEDAPENEALGEILAAGDRAKKLVRQLLAFSRKQALEFKVFDLNAVVFNFQSLISRAIREDIAIAMHLAENLPMVKGDIGQIEQVVMNLAVNAQDAMPEGGALTFETGLVELDQDYALQHSGVAPGNYVMLSVSDNGMGMDAETREHLFDPFFTTKGKDVGTGLGLSTVYGIVKQHQGNVWVYSEPGMGATFKIYLPAQSGPADDVASESKLTENFTGTETILLVEDSDPVLLLTLTMLKRNGYHVLGAENGRHALDMLKSFDGRLDLVLTDVVMPGMDGKQLARKVKDIYPHVKVIYMSGYTNNVIAHHGVIEHGVNMITKPFSYRALLAKVREVLDNDST